MPDREQKSMIGCLLWSALGAISFYLFIVVFGLGARTLAILSAWVGVVKQIEPEVVINFAAPGTIRGHYSIRLASATTKDEGGSRRKTNICS